MDVPDLVMQAIQYARLQERLTAAITTLGPVSAAIKGLNDLDDSLAPELGVAIDHLGGLLESLGRASTFVDTRFDVWLDQAKEEM